MRGLGGDIWRQHHHRSVLHFPSSIPTRHTGLSQTAAVLYVCVWERERCKASDNMTIRNVLRDHGQRYRPRMACLKKVGCTAYIRWCKPEHRLIDYTCSRRIISDLYKFSNAMLGLYWLTGTSQTQAVVGICTIIIYNILRKSQCFHWIDLLRMVIPLRPTGTIWTTTSFRETQ